MAFIPALIGGLEGLAGGLLNRPQTTTSGGTSSTTSNSSGTTTGTSLPNYDPMQLQMRNFLLNQFYNQANPNAIGNLVSNYTAGGINTINQGAGAAQQSLQNRLAGSGLSFSNAAPFAQSSIDQSRIGGITALRTQAPILQSNLQQSRLTDFSSFLQGLPVGQTTTGTTTQQGTQNTTQTGNVTQPGNILGGAASGIATTLAGLYGMGAFKGSQPSTYNPNPGGLGISNNWGQG